MPFNFTNMGKSSNTFFAFISGVAVGAVIGILYAPDKGKNTRDKLAFQLDKYKEKLSDLTRQWFDEKGNIIPTLAKQESAKVVSEASRKAEQLLGDVEQLIGQIQGK